MAIRAEVRITVLKRLYHKDLAELYTGPPAYGPCDMMPEGRQFIVPLSSQMPEGFCSFAWGEMHKYVLTLARGGDLAGAKPGVFVASCSDGFRPVIFLLERIDSPAAD